LAPRPRPPQPSAVSTGLEGSSLLYVKSRNHPIASLGLGSGRISPARTETVGGIAEKGKPLSLLALSSPLLTSDETTLTTGWLIFRWLAITVKDLALICTFDLCRLTLKRHGPGWAWGGNIRSVAFQCAERGCTTPTRLPRSEATPLSPSDFNCSNQQSQPFLPCHWVPVSASERQTAFLDANAYPHPRVASQV
jgi:hypothetical protein